MTLIVIALAAAVSVFHHYVFSFQRFTLVVARHNAPSAQAVPELQALMTPASIGALGWLSTAAVLATAVWIGFVFAWWWGILYFLADAFVFGAILPLFPTRHHFASLATSELSRHQSRLPPSLAEALHTDIQSVRETGRAV